MTGRQRLLGVVVIFALFIAMTPRETFWFAQTFGGATKIYNSLKVLVRGGQSESWTWDTQHKYAFGIEADDKDGKVLRMPWAQALIPTMSAAAESYTLRIEAQPADGVILKGSVCGKNFDLPVRMTIHNTCFRITRHLRITAQGAPRIEGNRLDYAHSITINLTATP